MTRLGLAVALCFVGCHAALADPNAAPAIDAEMFREGAIRNFSDTRGAWSFMCQEIVRVKKRVCNLAAHLKTEAGENFGSALVATDAANKTAILLRIPAPVVIARPVTLRAQFGAAKDSKKIVKYEKNADVGICASDGCRVFINLDNEIAFALGSGLDVTISYLRPLSSGVFQTLAKRGQQVTLKLTGEGFAAALDEANRR